MIGFIHVIRHKKVGLLITLSGVLALLCSNTKAQNTITYSCSALNFSGTTALKCNPISEDDPNDLAECYSYLFATLANNGQRFELGFPAKTGTYHVPPGKNDSLSATLYYDTNPSTYGYGITANAKDLTITITRYETPKGGIIEGNFSGTMEAYAAWNRQTVTVNVNGSFHTTRTGGAGSECRKLRRSENVAFDKAKSVIGQSIIQPLQRIGWQAEFARDSKPTAANGPNPYKPLFLCASNFDLNVTADPNSAYGQMLIDSIRYYAGQSDVPSIMRMVVLRQMQSMKIRIGVNMPYIKSPWSHNPAEKFTLMQIPGTGYGYRLTIPEQGADKGIPPDYKTYVLIGQWEGADMKATAYATYPFIHKQPGGYIETLTVQIAGPASVADKFIRAIDWQGLNAALTK